MTLLWDSYAAEMSRKGEKVRRPCGMKKVQIHADNLKDEKLMRRIDEENEKIRQRLEDSQTNKKD